MDNQRAGRNIGQGLIRVAAVLAIFAVLAIVVSADRTGLPPFLMQLYDFPGGDKVGHAFIFGTVTFFLHLALSGRCLTIARTRVPLAGLLVFLFAGIEELSQGYFASRTLSITDFLASCVGIVGGTVIAGLILKRRKA